MATTPARRTFARSLMLSLWGAARESGIEKRTTYKFHYGTSASCFCDALLQFNTATVSFILRRPRVSPKALTSDFLDTAYTLLRRGSTVIYETIGRVEKYSD